MSVVTAENGHVMEISLVNGRGEVRLDGRDIGDAVRGLKVEARVGQLVKVELGLILEKVEVRLAGDVDLTSPGFFQK